MTISAVALLVAGPPLYYLRYHHYPLFHAEVLLPTALWLLCAMGIGSLLSRASRSIRIIAFMILLVVFIDWQFSNHMDLPFKLLPLGVLVVVWMLERHVETVVAVTLAAFYLASLPTGSRNEASSVHVPSVHGDTLLPPVLYLILDQHIGIEGWPQEFAATREMRRQVRQLYLDEGFRLFGRAYSEFAHTQSSIPATLNWPIEDPRPNVAEIVPGQRYRLKTNELFRKLSAAGYQIRVYQSTFLDYCDRQAFAIRSCETRPANSIRNISLLDLPLWQKAELVGLFFLDQNSHLYARVQRVYSNFLERHGKPPWEAPNGWYTFPAAIELLDRLQADLRASDPRGTLYFAHLLAPHDGLVVDAACHPWTLPELQIGRGADRGTRTPAERAQRYGLYAAQVACLDRHLEALFHTIDSMPGGRRMVVIVHGDHGSWITLHDPSPRYLSAFQPSDLVDALSALFAIRAPGIPPGYDRRFAPVNELVGRALASGFTGIDAPEFEPHVMKMQVRWDLPFLTLRLGDTALVLAPGTTPK